MFVYFLLHPAMVQQSASFVFQSKNDEIGFESNVEIYYNYIRL